MLCMSKMASTTSLQPRCNVAMPVTTTHHVKPRRARCAAVVTGSAATASVAVAMACTPAAVAAPAERARMSTRRSAASSVAQMWRKVQGSGDWDGLLEPLHPVLRNELARYGELVGACYEALDVYPSSARYMNCKYGKERMLEKAGLAGAGYEVTKYIYAAPDVSLPAMEASTSGPASWVGYVAVTTDEQTRRLGRRDVLVSFRGTVTQAEWAANLMSSLEPARLDPSDPRPDVKVESGFLNLYTSADKACRIVGAGSCREQLLREVSRLITSHYKNHPGEDMSVTLAGHSMGSALAMLLAYDLAELDLNRDASERRVPVTVFSFGGPRVGNAAFKARCDELGVKALRVSNVRDPVTKLPGVFLNEGTTRGLLGAWSGACYTHVGVELALDFIRFRDLGSVHDLGTYVASLKAEADGEVANAEAGAEGGILTKAMEFVGRHSAGALSWHWQDAALQMGGLVHSIGLI